ncbi:glutathione S-transferase family protein [Ottowia sp. SB7-C50]|uniref:glutathione S-transferase family protein n=1 Tax=Ottowia sp. SB7-C50 TaxID=3081231 RepID=UPI00295558AD|nr:glutathione S-transferase family protein [Ottowia sp. SB7-C50]WOP15976.1 glutathione S-transferase family protein [Ottowia sp. SB7-C50]
MIQLWGRTTSINVRKVLWTLQEAGAPFERIDAGLAFGVVNDADYVAKNPNRLVPLLEDGDFVLWESNAIVRYLCARYAPALYPQDLRARFDAERWMDWQQTTLNRAGSPAFLQLVRTPPEQRKPEVIDASRAAMAPCIAMLNAHLSHRAWMGGDAFSMADIPVACDIHRWWNLPQPTPQAPHVQRWFNAVLARPATRGVLDLPLA